MQKRQCYSKAINAIQLPRQFELRADTVGSFRKSALWFGARQIPRELQILHKQLNDGLSETCGFMPEQRRYKPHITIQRKLEHVCRISQLETLIVSPVRYFSLIRSHLHKKGAIYEEIKRWNLPQ